MAAMTNPALQRDLATVASQLTRIGARARERRRFRRLPLVVTGRMLDSLCRESDFRTADLSPGDARITAPALPGLGERVVLYLSGLGRIVGHVARRGPDDAAVIFATSAHKREKLVEKLTIAINKDIIVEPEPRRAPRFVESGPTSLARIEFEDGTSYSGEVLDFSLTGVTIRSTRAPPPIGTWVRIGGAYGRVARVIERGFAVDFEPRASSQNSMA
jgi:hypothetical protein